MQAIAKQTLGAATRAVPPKVAERASPFTKSYLHSDEHWLLSERCHRCFFCFSVASLPSQALRASSPRGGNSDDRRQWRKQGVVVGAAASKTQAKRRGCWEPQPGCGAPLGRPVNFLLDAGGVIWRKRVGLATEGRLVFVQPLRHAYGVPPLLVGEALAGRATFYWTLKAQYNAKKSALLPRLAGHCCFQYKETLLVQRGPGRHARGSPTRGAVERQRD